MKISSNGIVRAGALLLLAIPAAAYAAQQWNEIPLAPGLYRESTVEHRSDTVDIPVKPNGGEIEYMLAVKKGDTVVYSWRALDIAEPGKLTSEFQGHTSPPPNMPGTLIFYRKATGASEAGAMTAAFDGNHGWYLKNDTDKPVVVRLTVSGFYQVIPGQIR
jgi:hypothetical protein